MNKEIAELTAEMRRCMGGVDPAGCTKAAKQLALLRASLQNTELMNAHLLRVVNTPESVSKKKRRTLK